MDTAYLSTPLLLLENLRGVVNAEGRSSLRSIRFYER